MNKPDTTAIHARENAPIQFDYTNWRGETAHRRVEVGHVWWGATEWHPEPGWMMSAFDLDKREWRDFAMKDMADVKPI